MGNKTFTQDEMKLGNIYVGQDPRDLVWIPIIVCRISDTRGDQIEGSYQMTRIDNGVCWNVLGYSSITEWYHITSEFTAALKEVVKRYETRSQ